MARRPFVTLIAVGVVVLVLSGAVFVRSSATQQDTLIVEIGKALAQLVLVVALGTGLKLLVDQFQADQQQRVLKRQELQVKEEQDQAFRDDIYGRLVQATNTLRRVPILIEANRSTKTWSEQMLAVIEVGTRPKDDQAPDLFG